MRQRYLLGWLLFCVMLSPGARLLAGPDFETEIAPIIAKRCLECHNARDAQGGLVLTTSRVLQPRGDQPAAILPGKPDDSLLLQRVTAGEMPPPRRGKPQVLPEREQTLLRAWIADGAAWPKDRTLDLFEASNDVRAGRDWWSLQPIRQPEQSRQFSVDHFIQERLRAENLTPAPPASKAVLIRRLYDDLLGLPPTYEQVKAFEQAANPQAYEQMVDQLLASPHFGERQARHWLDLVRFAETCGYERDQTKPFAWKYRDYVVQSFNADKPYNRFVQEQLAGDELPDRSEETVIATGFLMLGTWNDEPNDPQEYKYERLEDLVHAASSAFLGISVKCARCHDHKFDPVPQEDYYRMAAAFWPGPIEPRGRELIGGVTADELGVAEVLGWTDLHKIPAPLALLKKGDPRHPLAPIEPGHLSFVPALVQPWLPPAEQAKTSQRRWQLAQWITDPANPLTPRVMVNRVWLQLFGQGLVRSPNDFGFNGAPPTHPELLDWLAADFRDQGWRLKRLYKQVVMSQTYRQSSVHPQQADYLQRDAGNTQWWRAERRRRAAESLRDAMLSVSGEIDLRLGGPSFKPSISAEALEGLSKKSAAWQESPAAEQRRRSLYGFSQRSLLPPMMTTFDFPDTTLPCPQRDQTIVAPQALSLLNGQFTQDRSLAFARRVRAASSQHESLSLITAAWQMALGRSPLPNEIELARRHLKAQEEHFQKWASQAIPAEIPPELPVREGLVLHLRADAGVTANAKGRVSSWKDQSAGAHHAVQANADQQPQFIADRLHGHPVIHFDGQSRMLELEGQVLKSGELTILAVVNDLASDGHREIFSNWDGAAGNSVTSLFLGLTAENQVRLSDAFAPAGTASQRKNHFLLTAVVSKALAAVFQNEQELARKPGGLGPRNLTGKYVLGAQGNLKGEYWHGDMAELIVFDRAVTDAERKQLSRYLVGRYRLAEPPMPPDPKLLALASLCQVLLNTNEFMYVD